MKKLIAVIVILVLSLIPSSCFKSPPSAEDIEAFMKENRNDILLVNEYLLEIEGRHAIIWDNKGTILIDLCDQQIENDAVKKALRFLWQSRCYRIVKYDEDNAIAYHIWSRTMGGVSCGFVYAIDHTRSPKVQYLTKLIPLSEDGWYYYLADYEEWRVLKHDKD